MKRYLRKVIYCTESTWTESLQNLEGILFIADREDILRMLKEKKMPVAAWLHENNRDQDLSAAVYAVENPQELDSDFYEKIYRREKNIPWEILETERCLVREMVPEDAEAFADIYGEERISRYMKDFHQDVEGERRYIEEYRQQYCFFEYGVWSVVLKETGEVIGRVGFSEIPADMADVGETHTGNLLQFGYVIGVPWQRQGIAYEVCRAVLDYARAEWGIEKALLLTEADNVASVGLGRKLSQFGLQMFPSIKKYSKESPK